MSVREELKSPHRDVEGMGRALALCCQSQFFLPWSFWEGLLAKRNLKDSKNTCPTLLCK